VPGIDLENFAIFFWVGIALSAVGIVLLRSLPDSRASLLQ
jgi:hypothetical protein